MNWLALILVILLAIGAWAWWDTRSINLNPDEPFGHR